VNVSVHQLLDSRFVERLDEMLERHALPAGAIELELTETAFQTSSSTIDVLRQVGEGGLDLVLDDFGTGYSSLSALQQFPISTLKIDKSFVRHMSTNPDDATIVSTIIQMGRNLDLDVVAEGVESEDQLALLQKLGCTFVQGLLFGDPMSSDSYLELLLAQAEGTDTYRALFVG